MSSLVFENINLNIMATLLSRRSHRLLFLHVKAIGIIDTPHLTYIGWLTSTIILVIGGMYKRKRRIRS